MKYLLNKILIAVPALLLCICHVRAQTLPKPEVDILQSLEHNLSYLADDHMEGRLIGSRGEKIAYDFITGNFQSLNLLPKGEQGFIQTFSIHKIAFKTGSLLITNKTGDIKFDKMIPAKNFPLSYSKPGSVSDKCIWLGYGIEAPALGHNDYAGNKNINGKIAVIKLGQPDYENPHAALAAYANLEAKIDTAILKGASGIIIINVHKEIIEPDFKPIVKASFKSVPVYFLSYDNHLDSGNFMNAKASIMVDTTSVTLEGHNVIAYINNKSVNTIVIGAHYDHLGYNELGGSTYRKPQNEKPQVHNGADDNASGTAALIEMAELLQKSPYRSHNYLFIAFSGEEEGLLGSHYFVEHPTIPLKNISYMLNMDMVGRLDTVKNIFSLSGTGTSPRWDSILPDIVIDNIKVKYEPGGTGASDHTSFYNAGIPVLHFFSGTHQEYHKPSDDWELINFKGTLQIIKYMYQLIAKLDKQPKLIFTKTKESTDNRTEFKVTLGIMPDYMFEGNGVRVDGVTDGRPAALAGLKRGDIIIRLDKFDTGGMEAYMQALSKLEKGLQTKVTILRNGNEMVLDIKL
ncbi:MAG: M28 family peptidase [Bacteroidia bacterium]|nr:M28 family peptidase [Bacteroidia bacterium]